MFSNNRSRGRNGWRRSAVLAGLAVTGGSVVLYVLKRWWYKQQLKVTEQRLVQEQIKRRFGQTQRDALYALYELIPVFSLVLSQDEFDLERLIVALRDKKLNKRRLNDLKDGESFDVAGMSSTTTENPVGAGAAAEQGKSKTELWNELKLKSITKVITVSYTLSALLLLTRIQLNILTRREYLENAVKLAMAKENTSSMWNWVVAKFTQPHVELEDDKEINFTYINEQAFLSLSWWLLNKGWAEISNKVESNVQKEFEALNPRETLTLQNFGDKLIKIFYAVNASLLTDGQLRHILLPPDNLMQDFVLQQTLDPETWQTLQKDNSVLKHLVQETERCVDSTATLIVMESLTNESFQYIMDSLQKKLAEKNSDQHQVALYAISCKDCCHTMLQEGRVSLQNEFLSQLNAVAALDDLSASVYSNFGL